MNIRDITATSGEVEINGWVHDIRDMGGLKFLLIRDGTGIIQTTVVSSKASQEILDTVSQLNPESCVSISGVAKDSSKVKSGVEIIPSTITLLSRSKSELPISVTEKAITTGQAKRLDYRSLDLRKLKHQAIFRVQSALLEGMREYLLGDGFQQVFTPCVLGVASESGSEVFPLIYFNREAFLRQDPQLHRQLTIAGGMTKIFDIGPAWRAEQSHTVKHLCEHRVCAVELAFIKDEHDTMRVEEQVIISALKKVQEKCSEDLKLLGVELTIPKAPFPVLQFPEVYDILESMGKHLERGEDLDSEADKLVWEYVKENYNSEFYFINRFPFQIKPFYVMQGEEPQWARSVDLNFRGMELSSGGQREHRFEQLMENVRKKGMNPSEVEWFTQFFEFGVPPHGGFAIGIERLTMTLLDIENIRDCVLFPRDPERIVP